MIEPPSPVTIHITYTQQKAVDLPTDEGQPLSTSSVILRHRHLRQLHGAASVAQTTQGPPGRPTKGVTVNFGGPLALRATHAEVASSKPEEADVHSGLPVSPAGTSVGVPKPSNTPAKTTPGRNNLGPMSMPLKIQPIRDERPAVHSSPVLDETADTMQPAATTALRPRESSVSDKSPTVVRKSHRIRSTREKTTWYESSGRDLLPSPLLVPLACFGDLYVHTTPDAKQIWLQTADKGWLSIDVYHPHPWLPGYQLHFIANGEPRWVTQDSLRTYQTRLEKRKREKDASRQKQDGAVGRQIMPADIAHLETELALCKAAMRIDNAVSCHTQLDAYRSLWVAYQDRCKQLEDVLVKHVDEPLIKQLVPLHPKFRDEVIDAI
ncbi:hypothetical protein FKP32DRAFT_1671630 [Trametes sanguinea]|nr:hypothetical protein FKP32DRAFT_1671630 [Trametes sanguinea]